MSCVVPATKRQVYVFYVFEIQKLWIENILIVEAGVASLHISEVLSYKFHKFRFTCFFHNFEVIFRFTLKCRVFSRQTEIIHRKHVIELVKFKLARSNCNTNHRNKKTVIRRFIFDRYLSIKERIAH